MVIVRIMGGLGNQLFQYAAGRSVSCKHKVPLKLDLSYYRFYGDTKWARKYGLQHFATIQDEAKENEIIEAKKFLHFKEEHFSYHREIKQVGPEVYLDGYWQSEQYFQDIIPTIQKELVNISKPTIENRRMAKRIQSGNESVCLHIRRGDYVTDRHVANILGPCGLDYYERAIRMISKHVTRPHFYLFSDDAAWVRQNLKIGYPSTLVDINDEVTCHEDMRLMSLCRHNIIANSTFSWWGAWLSQCSKKIIIAPKKWLRQQTKAWDSKDLIPHSWYRL